MGLLKKKSEKNCSAKSKKCNQSKCKTTSTEKDTANKSKNCSGSKCLDTKNCSTRTTNKASRKTKACAK